MGKLLCAIGLAALLGQAQAQTGAMPVQSPWSFKTIMVKATVTPLRTSTTGFTAIAGQAQAVNLALNTVSAVFPGQKTSAMVVSGLRLSVTSQAGWTANTTVDLALPGVVTVPAGRTLAVRLDYPLVGAGTLQWAVGATSISGPITPAPPPPPTPSPAPPPVVTPPPLPPPSTVTASKPGDYTGVCQGCANPPLSQLVDASGVVWTFVGGQAFRNNVGVAKPHTDDQRLYVSASGGIRVESPSKGYLCWIGSAWSGSGC